MWLDATPHQELHRTVRARYAEDSDKLTDHRAVGPHRIFRTRCAADLRYNNREKTLDVASKVKDARAVQIGLTLSSVLWAGREFPTKPGERTVPNQLLVSLQEWCISGIGCNQPGARHANARLGGFAVVPGDATRRDGSNILATAQCACTVPQGCLLERPMGFGDRAGSRSLAAFAQCLSQRATAGTGRIRAPSSTPAPTAPIRTS